MQDKTDKILDLVEKIYVNIQDTKKELKQEIMELRTELQDVKKTVLKIEDEHGKKLQALFDGYKQHSDQLDRIEKEVSKHDEFILRRIK